MSRFRTANLAELQSTIIDNRGRTCPTASTGSPLIATNCIKEDSEYPVFEKIRFVDDETMKTWFRGHPKPNDIIFVCKGSPGRCALAPDPVGFAIAQDMVALRPDPTQVYWRYLYYILKLPSTRSSIENLFVGTLIPHFKKGDFNKLQLRIHRDLAEQRAIAEVLGALDDKIAANRKLVTTIDDLASALYKQSATNARLLTDLASFVNGRNFTKNATGDGRVVVRIAELNSGIGSSTVHNKVDDVADDNLVRSGDILFAWSGSLTLHRWTQPEALVNQHIFKVIPKDDVPYWLAYQAVREKLPEFKAIAADKATTMGHIQRHHLDTDAAVPPAGRIQELDPLMSPLWERAISADEESRTLAELRDTLLPALMDGTIRVTDAEKKAEEVL